MPLSQPSRNPADTKELLLDLLDYRWVIEAETREMQAIIEENRVLLQQLDDQIAALELPEVATNKGQAF